MNISNLSKNVRKLRTGLTQRSSRKFIAKFIFLACILLRSSFLAYASGSENGHATDVFELTSRSFSSIIGTHGGIPIQEIENDNPEPEVVWLVNFYAPWCGHCRRFEPDYERAAEQLHGKYNVNSRKVVVRVGRIDGSVDRALVSRFGVVGFPMVFLIDGSKVYEYKGQRKSDHVIKWAVDQDYTSSDPMTLMKSPFGPVGMLKGYMVVTGLKVSDFQKEILVGRLGLSPLIAAALFVLIFIFGTLFLVMGVTVLTMPKVKVN